MTKLKQLFHKHTFVNQSKVVNMRQISEWDEVSQSWVVKRWPEDDYIITKRCGCGKESLEAYNSDGTERRVGVK